MLILAFIVEVVFNSLLVSLFLLFSCAMMFMQSNAPASCQVIKPLTPDDWKNYEIELVELVYGFSVST